MISGHPCGLRSVASLAICRGTARRHALFHELFWSSGPRGSATAAWRYLHRTVASPPLPWVVVPGMRDRVGHGAGILYLVPTSLGVARQVSVPSRIICELCFRRRPSLLRRRPFVTICPPPECEGMAPHIQCPYATCSRTFGGANGLHRHMQVHHHEHVDVADAVLTDLEGPVHDPDDDGDSGGDADGGAGACGAAGDVSAGGADDGGDAGPNPAGGGWSSSKSASTFTTDDDEGPPDERAWSSGWSTSESDDGSDSTQPVTDWDDDYESTDDTLAPHSRAADNRSNVNSVFVHSLRA